MSEAAELPQSAPIGPGSEVWEHTGRRYNMLVALAGGTMQVMYPSLGAGVVEWSRFFEDPGERLANSVDPILGVIYGPDPKTTGREIRDIHRNMKGTDDQGRDYHALRPPTYWWAHANFTVMVEQGIDRFSGDPLTPERREQLYRESVTWYSRYGLSMRPVPKDRTAFQAEYDRVCEDVLEMTPAAEQAIGMFQEGDIESFVMAIGIRPEAWKAGRKVISEVVRLCAIGGLPETVRERFDIPFSGLDIKKLQALDKIVQTIAPRLSDERFYFPVALEGMRREEQQIAA